MRITAVVDCGDAFGGVDPLLPVGAEPMVVRAVRSILDAGLVERVEVLVSPERSGAVVRACRGLPVSIGVGLAPAPIRTHADQRAGARSGDGSITTRPAGIVLLHEATRPLAPPELTVAVVEAVRCGHPAAVPALPVTDTVKQVDEAGLVSGSPDRTTLRALQTPIAVRADLLQPELLTGSPLRVVGRLVGSGVPVHCVPGHPLAFPVHTAWDLELAQLLATAANVAPGNGR